MGIIETRLRSGNLTVVGNFNPAILTHEFLTTVCGLQRPEPLKSSEPNVPVVREIQYDNERWFMDLDRMIVEDMQIESFEAFRAPEAGVTYLDMLAYTPLRAAGVNLYCDFGLSAPGTLWTNLRNDDRIAAIIQGFGGLSADLDTRLHIRSGESELISASLGFDLPDDMRALLKLERLQMVDYVRAHLNWEWRGLAGRRDRLDSIPPQSRFVGEKFVKLVDILSSAG